MLNSLTSLRFFFALAVFFSHLTFIKTDLVWYNWIKNTIFFEGYVGVGFFFILSGFVLALNYQHKVIQPNFSFKNFYIARFARIYPLHLITFCIMIPYVVFMDLFQWDKALLNISLLQSYIPYKAFYFTINNVSWSISTEFFFYLMFPFYVIGLMRYPKLKYTLLLIIPTIIISEPHFAKDRDLEKGLFYINPLVRSFDFILGIVLCQVYQKIKGTPISISKGTLLELAALLLFIVFFSFHEEVARAYRYGIYYWLPMAAIVLIFAMQKGYISKLLQHKKLVYLGEISFGFYMIHMMIIKYGNHFFPEFNQFMKIGIYFTTALILSAFCFEYFEKPMNKWIKKKWIKSS